MTTDGKPEYVDVETLLRTFPGAELYEVPDAVYDDVLNGAGYPVRLEEFPLTRCTRLR